MQESNSLKIQLAAQGVNSRGWRLYLDYGYKMFAPLGFDWADLACANELGLSEIAWLKILQACEMDVLPPPQLVKSVPHWKIPDNQLALVPPLFVRLAWKACIAAQYQTDTMDDFIAKELIPLAQWFFESGTYKTATFADLKTGWASMQRLRREYADTVAHTCGADDWPPIIRRYESGALVMTALSYARQLIAEGAAMQHCVGDYAERCRHEPLRIFSVRNKKTGARVATLSVVEKTAGRWKFDQLKGPLNAEVDIQVWREADGLCQTLNHVSCSDTKSRRYLDFIHSLRG